MAKRRSIIVTLTGRMIFFGGIGLIAVGCAPYTDISWTPYGIPVYRATFRAIVIVLGLCAMATGHLVARRRGWGLLLLLAGCVFAVLNDLANATQGAEAAFWYGLLPGVVDLAVMCCVYHFRGEFVPRDPVERFLFEQLQLGGGAGGGE